MLAFVCGSECVMGNTVRGWGVEWQWLLLLEYITRKLLHITALTSREILECHGALDETSTVLFSLFSLVMGLLPSRNNCFANTESCLINNQRTSSFAISTSFQEPLRLCLSVCMYVCMSVCLSLSLSFVDNGGWCHDDNSLPSSLVCSHLHLWQM